MSWLLLLLAGGALAGDAPEISRSAGEEGGVVVLWPRVIPKSTSQTSRSAAWLVHQELQAIAGEVLSGMPIDVRPEPERVCPQAGCKGVVLGAVVVHSGDACVAVATVSGPGRSAQTLIPWAGTVDLKELTVPFREPPESFVTIRDFSTCSGLKKQLEAGSDRLRQAVAAQAGVPLPPRTGPGPTAPPPVTVPPQKPSEPVEGW